MTWKFDIVEGLEASLRCQSFETYLPTFILLDSIKFTWIFTITIVKAFIYHYKWYRLKADSLEMTNKMELSVEILVP